jgi:hypothetical protein
MITPGQDACPQCYPTKSARASRGAVPSTGAAGPTAGGRRVRGRQAQGAGRAADAGRAGAGAGRAGAGAGRGGGRSPLRGPGVARGPRSVVLPVRNQPQLTSTVTREASRTPLNTARNYDARATPLVPIRQSPLRGPGAKRRATPTPTHAPPQRLARSPTEASRAQLDLARNRSPFGQRPLPAQPAEAHCGQGAKRPEHGEARYAGPARSAGPHPHRHVRHHSDWLDPPPKPAARSSTRPATQRPSGNALSQRSQPKPTTGRARSARARRSPLRGPGAKRPGHTHTCATTAAGQITHRNQPHANQRSPQPQRPHHRSTPTAAKPATRARGRSAPARVHHHRPPHHKPASTVTRRIRPGAPAGSGRLAGHRAGARTRAVPCCRSACLPRGRPRSPRPRAVRAAPRPGRR